MSRGKLTHANRTILPGKTFPCLSRPDEEERKPVDRVFGGRRGSCWPLELAHDSN